MILFRNHDWTLSIQYDTMIYSLRVTIVIDTALIWSASQTTGNIDIRQNSRKSAACSQTAFASSRLPSRFDHACSRSHITCATAWIRRHACHTANAFACIWLPFVQDVGPKRQPTAIACQRSHLQTECLYYDVVGLIFVCGALCVPQGPLHLAAFACVCLRLLGLFACRVRIREVPIRAFNAL